MRYTRREFGTLAAAAIPAALTTPLDVFAQGHKPNSLVSGVQLGVITYSYRSLPDQSAEATLRYIVDSGISAIELMNGPAESFAGAPASRRGGQGGEQLKQWRTSVSLDRFKALRKVYNDAGVSIYAWKVLNPAMSDEEFEYVFDVAEALGCTHTTLELPTDAAQLKRIGQFAEKRKVYAAYHTHTQATMTSFDEAFAVSKANLSNIDLGHYVAGTGESPIPFLRKHHGRIASVHLKDRTTPSRGAKNLPWGTGDTPLVEILQLMKRERYTFPASIELEYDVPAGSDAVTEVTTCLAFCKRALA